MLIWNCSLQYVESTLIKMIPNFGFNCQALVLENEFIYAGNESNQLLQMKWKDG